MAWSTVIYNCATALIQWRLTPVVLQAMSILTQRTKNLTMIYNFETVGITFKRLKLFLLMLDTPGGTIQARIGCEEGSTLAAARLLIS